MKEYYHISDVDNLADIESYGLKLNSNGELFLFDNIECATSIAVNQCFLEIWALFKITGIEEERLKHDNVAEFTAKHQWIYDKDISCQCVELIDIYSLPPDNLMANQRRIYIKS